MTPSRKSHVSPRSNTKRLLTTLKLTTTIGAVSLTLTGWALLSRVEAINAASSAQAAPSAFSSNVGSAGALASSPPATADVRPETVANADVSRVAVATATAASPTSTPLSSAAVSGIGASPTASPTASLTATPTTAPTATPEPKFKLDIVQWVKTNAGDPVAVVRDNRGVLWYVWGADVPRIEQGLRPQYQPQPVNRVGRTRRS